MAGNLLRIQNIVNSQTKNQNRFSMNFNGLGQVLARARNSGFPGARTRFAALYDALKRNEGEYDINQTLQLSLLSVTLPNIQIDTQRLPKFNDSTIATTKFAETEDMTINFIDYVDGSASAIMLLWQSLVGDKRTGAMGFKQSYTLPAAEFIVYGPDAPAYEIGTNTDSGEKTEIPWIEIHEIVNLFPKSVNLGEHSYENGEYRRVECTFGIDNIYPIAYRNWKINPDTNSAEYTDALIYGSVGARQNSPFSKRDLDKFEF